jgi:bud emergence protein 1
VSFVEIRDPTTGRALDVMPKDIPQVEEWKKATAEYKASSIPLGRFDFDPSQSGGVANSPYAPQNTAPPPAAMKASGSMASLGAASTGSDGARVSQHGQQRVSSSSKPPQTDDRILPPGSLLAASVVSFHFEEQYWFRVHATYLPDNPSQPALSLALFRLYEDFYEFQIALLAAFPREAGRSTSPVSSGSPPPERILPFMPGPLDEVNDEITEIRREDLHAYLNDLLDLRDIDAGYVLRHELVREFFSVRAGDYQTEVERRDVEDGVEERLAELSINSNPTVATFSQDRSQSVVSRSSARQSVGERSSAQAWAQNGGTPASSRGASPLPQIDTSRQPEYSPLTPSTGGQNSSTGLQTGTSSSSWGSNHPYGSQPSPAPQAQQQQPPFIKIKIFDPTTDDLIAIRAPPKVTYDQLLDKVRDRLGHEVRSLRYRISGGGGAVGAGGGMYRDIENDRELAEWLAREDKLVLYAERD